MIILISKFDVLITWSTESHLWNFPDMKTINIFSTSHLPKGLGPGPVIGLRSTPHGKAQGTVSWVTPPPPPVNKQTYIYVKILPSRCLRNTGVKIFMEISDSVQTRLQRNFRSDNCVWNLELTSSDLPGTQWISLLVMGGGTNSLDGGADPIYFIDFLKSPKKFWSVGKGGVPGAPSPTLITTAKGEDSNLRIGQIFSQKLHENIVDDGPAYLGQPHLYSSIILHTFQKVVPKILAL